MKPSALREISTNELKIKLNEMKELLFRYRFQFALGQNDNPKKYRETRRDIARVKTILNERIKQEQKNQSISK